jgi:hypothetical protein
LFLFSGWDAVVRWWLAAAAIGGAIALAPIVSAATDPAPIASAATHSAPVSSAGADPLVPYGTDPQVSSLGFHESNHDDVDTTNGFVDVPF